MALQVTVNLSEKTYTRLKRFAKERKQAVDVALAEYIENHPPVPARINQNTPNAQALQEIEAYHQFHPSLWEKYPNQFVAIHGEKIVDTDQDKMALLDRIETDFPDKFVLIRQVIEQPEQTLHFRSIRFLDK